MKPNYSIYKIVAKSTGIVVFIVLCTLLFLKGFKVVLLILGGVLFAAYFLGIATFLSKRFPINKSIAVIFTIITTFTILFFVIRGISPSISRQIVALEEKLPTAWAKVESEIKQNDALYYFLRPIIRSVKVHNQNGDEFISSFFSSMFGVAGDFYVMIFLGLFFTAQPSVYINGIIKLFPKDRRNRTKEVLSQIGYTLRNWLLGKLLSMLIIGFLVCMGLLALGVPLALTLGIFTAFMAFIPNFGPIISLIPALLIAFTISNELTIYTFITYMGIQAVESNLITPYIHKQLISLPMAMILIAQVVLGIFTGYLGLIFAVPVVAIILVIIKMVYIQDVLKDESVRL